MRIEENVNRVKQDIAVSCKNANRSLEEITLVAVSKTMPAEKVLEAYEAGCRDFGENKVQEIVDKYDKLPKDISWHMIGHLQRNKVKYIIDKVSLIHSVDSMRLAEEISKQAQKHQLIMPVLLEVNISGEMSKFGIDPTDVFEFIKEASKLPGIMIKGLMTVAPFVEEADKNAQYFIRLKQLAVDITTKNIDNTMVDVLSMGMSGDYQVAIKEGATIIRIGTGIFGERQYQI